jgi:hypothetical protein
MKTTRPCIVCGHADKNELNRHHLLPKEVRPRDGNVRQILVKLCAEKYGCRSHFDFHVGDKEAAMNIRENLEDWEVEWMIDMVGEEWVQTIYPERP